MRAKKRKIRRVLQVREQELAEQVAVLSAARAAEEEAQRVAERAGEDLKAASQRRRELAGSTADARRWLEEDEWYRSRDSERNVRVGDAQRARAVASDARERVLDARSRVRQVEVLAERVSTAEGRAKERAERRAEDEVAARIASRGAEQGRQR